MTAQLHFLPDAERTKRMTSAELRAAFLVQGLFVPGKVVLRHVDLDRVVLGGAVPTSVPLDVEAPPSVGAAYLAERRELGILNIGNAGTVTLDGKTFALGARDALYVGRGVKRVTVASDDPKKPARFYLVSYPAHAPFDSALVIRSKIEPTLLGAPETANRRSLYKYIHPGGAKSSQLMLGVTELASGSVWNTMPPHTHNRRTEVYLYFDLPDDAMVVHMMGEPDDTRHLVVRNEEVILSPGWSIHAGCGTASYSFCWAMGGENQDFADMQGVAIPNLK
jgi:4-deoxy-L-threo-5-hexosulose-uronate ketol-isomerase